MIERLTKSKSPLVNGFFEMSLTCLLAGGVVRALIAWWKMSGLTSTIAATCAGLALWGAVLGLYRLWKG
ncbi:MAG TPA: hypothetical protein VGW12_06590 [Pyrinomonadaceae bacterium]|nr:hypothetical protein [Pyrinomonadaceae bacterium]